MEEYGQIFFNITGADSTAFVELLDAQDKVYVLFGCRRKSGFLLFESG